MKSEHLPPVAKLSDATQWDPGMRASVQFCLAEFWEHLTFLWGYEINKKANEADMVIVKKSRAGRLGDIVAEFLDDINVLELKSPGDHLGIGELCKAVAYALLIVAYGFEGRAVEPNEVTITLVREERPDKVISYLKSKGLDHSNPYPGVYRFTGDHFPIQIIAYGEMEDDRWLVLRSMTREMTPQMREAVRDVLAPFRAPGVREELVETIVHTYFNANKKLFEEGDPMYEWLEPVYKPKMDRIAAESEARGMALGRSEGMALGRSEGMALGRSEGGLSMLFGLVRKGRLTSGEASEEAGLTLAAFNAKMAEYEARPRAQI